VSPSVWLQPIVVLDAGVRPVIPIPLARCGIPELVRLPEQAPRFSQGRIMARTLHPPTESVNPTHKTSPPPEAGLMQPKRRILIAEDNEVNRQQLKHLLESDQVDVDTVGDGIQALEALTGNNYSLVITDLKMPRLSGMQLIEEVQKRRLPVTVIVTTGYG